MLEAINRVTKYIRGMDHDGFVADERTVDAVVRNLEVLGEAATRLSETDKGLQSDLPWEKMRSLRNKVAHEYFGVNASIIWQTATGDLPPLVAPLRNLLSQLDIE